MDIEKFETLMLYTLVPGLILFMGFIIWDVAKKSKIGKLGTWILFGVLGLGVLGFIIKEIIITFMGV